MKPRCLLFALPLVFPVIANAQLVIDETLSPIELVQDVLLGNGVTVNNVSYNGFPAMWVPEPGSGSFTATGTDLGIGSGVILSTGFVSYAVGPAWNMADEVNGTGWDQDLEIISGQPIIEDQAVLEFDFIPNGNTISFRYVFASEEYNGYVCSPFNDAFGFFLSGPGIAGPYTNGAVNLAVVPGTNVPVTINSVNGGFASYPGDEWMCDNVDPNWMANSVYYVDNLVGNWIAYDGFTVVLEASAQVQCGETYHIKLAIGDAGDEYLDSAVFLEANSFNSEGQTEAELAASVGVVDDTMLEGCGQVELVFTRSGDISAAASVDIAAGGTATAGVDYTPVFPAQIDFAAGAATASLFLDVPADADGLETLIVTITNSVACAGSVGVDHIFYIDEPPPLDVTLDDETTSCGVSQVLTPVVTGGMGNYTFDWDTNESTSSITVSPGTDTEYTVTVGDDCDVTPVTVTATVYVVDDPILLDMSADVAVPCGELTEISVLDVTGGNGVYDYTWTNDGVIVGNSTSINVSASDPTYYVLTVTDGCGATAQDSVEVSTLPVDPLSITVDDQQVLPCVGQIPVGVVDVQGGNGNYTYAWTFNGNAVGSSASANVNAEGWYIVTVTEGCGESVQDSVEVVPEVYDPLVITMSDDLLIPCQQQDQVSVIDVQGGNGPYSYEWHSNGSLLATGAAYPITAGMPTWYVATVTDVCGTSVEDSVLVESIVIDDLVVLTTDDQTIVCPGDPASFEVLGVPDAVGVVQYIWYGPNGSIIGAGPMLDIMVTGSQIFTVAVIDECANTGDTTVAVNLTYDPDLQVVLPADTMICAGETVDLIATVSGGSGYYSLEWQNSELTDPVWIATPEQSTWYSVTATDQCGASVTDAVLIEVEHHSVEIRETSTGQDDWYLETFTQPYAEHWVWDMGDGTRYRMPNVTHSYMDLEEHWVHVQTTSPLGCLATDSVLLRPPADIHFPNAFTPDGDGINDWFGPIGHYIDEFELLIYDRWGELIFQTQDVDQLWDGEVNGSKAMTGVYVYRYRAVGHNLPAQEGIGHVTLLTGDAEY